MAYHDILKTERTKTSRWPLLEELSLVRLTEPVSDSQGGSLAGTVGTIVEVFPEGPAYLVEFVAPPAVMTVEAAQVEPYRD